MVEKVVRRGCNMNGIGRSDMRHTISDCGSAGLYIGLWSRLNICIANDSPIMLYKLRGMDPTNTSLYNTSDVSHKLIKAHPEEVLEIYDECRENRICKKKNYLSHNPTNCL